MTDWARAIRLARVSIDVRSQDFALLVRIEPHHFSRIESGRRKPTQEQLELIARETGLTVDLLRVLAEKPLREVLEAAAAPRVMVYP